MEQALTPHDMPQLRTIVVDLTPVLPGGENGGAKVFVLELLRRLAERAPKTQFVLLTQAAAHEELAALDGRMSDARHGARCRRVAGHAVTGEPRCFPAFWLIYRSD